MFNQKSRTENITKTSITGAVCKVLTLGMGFAYRTVFLHFLSAAYLGLDGMFTNILIVLSFADLGISSAISFRLYEPICSGNTAKVGQLMHFYRKVYLLVALVIIAAGSALFPFLDHFIKDASEIPPDVNIRVIYLLFLFQTVASYLFVTPQMLLSADQKQYALSVCETAAKFVMYAVQIAVLALTQDFTLCLLLGILTTVICNIVISACVKRRYRDVFKVKEDISAEEKKHIFSDTTATLCHKVGTTVLIGTDSIILSRFAGLVAAGLYANYYLIINGLSGIFFKMFTGISSSFGNAHFSADVEERYKIYRRLQFLNFWVVGLCTVCLMLLISDFITLWLGKSMVLNRLTVFAVSFQFYLESIRWVTNSYTYGAGYFTKDKLRPFIEAAINIAASIILVIKIGIAGVFFGTIISHLLTATWREPHILYKYEFKRSVWEYWRYFGIFTLGTLLISAALSGIKSYSGFVCSNFGLWLLEGIICAGVYTLVMVVIFAGNEDLKYYISKVKSRRKDRLL